MGRNLLGAIAGAVALGWTADWEPPLRMGPGRKKTDTGWPVEGVKYGVPWHAPKKTGRNQPCPCGSGDKYKHCFLKGKCKGEL